MARYIVTARGSDVIGADETDEGLFLIVQVTDENGAPVTGLKKGQFHIWYLGGIVVDSQVNIFFFSEIKVDIPSTDLPGVYIIKLDANEGMQKGTFVFGILVKTIDLVSKAVTRGQTLVDMTRII